MSDPKHLIQIPITAGTGSEATPIAIVTTRTSSKLELRSSNNLRDVRQEHALAMYTAAS